MIFISQKVHVSRLMRVYVSFIMSTCNLLSTAGPAPATGTERLEPSELRTRSSSYNQHCCRLKGTVHKNENFFGSDFDFCSISLLVMLQY
jgi:hypothetical protein